MLSACASSRPTCSTVGIRIAASTLRLRGSATPSVGSAAITRSATAAWNTDRTTTNRVLIVVAIHYTNTRVELDFDAA